MWIEDFDTYACGDKYYEDNKMEDGTSDSVSKKGLSNKERREHRPEWSEWEPFGYVGGERNIQRWEQVEEVCSVCWRSLKKDSMTGREEGADERWEWGEKGYYSLACFKHHSDLQVV